MPAVRSPRPLAAADLDRVAAIERVTFPDAWSRDAFAHTLARPSAWGVALDDEQGTLVGYGICAVAADEGEILNLAVDPASRRRGAGRRLLEAMVTWLEGHGVRDVFLEVRASNAAAIALYERSGFRRLGVRKGYYRGPTEDAVTMRLEVGMRHAVKR